MLKIRTGTPGRGKELHLDPARQGLAPAQGAKASLLSIPMSVVIKGYVLGFSAPERLERAVSDRLAAGAPPPTPPGNPPKAPAPRTALPASKPATRLPLPPAHWASPRPRPAREIDVVTVEKRQSLGVRKPVTITVRADPLDPCMKHFHVSIHQQQHNYAARFPPESCSQGGAPERGPQEEALERDAPEEEEEEADEETVSRPPGESEAPQSCHPKPGSSDTEDVTKRKNHNFLERKRRNDVPSRFLALRDQVPPTLASCSKASKVVILSKALEYLQALVGAEKRVATEKRQLRCRQQQLQKGIAYLSGYYVTKKPDCSVLQRDLSLFSNLPSPP
ncbi:unnamed protein product [Nyctereutes procyonoides]|uniref:Myc proto-oncogene protein n=1 Tax=Nyctereutes procyonoides TaxID=34880 RepID=A0A811Z8Q2_NYCPR|nr:unnamed protein product [Nyctereutes procyonoides]